VTAQRKRGEWISRRSWTTEEEQKLRELTVFTKQHAAQELNRTICSVEIKARKLRLQFTRQPYNRPNDIVHPWTDQEKQELLNLAGMVTIAKAAVQLKRTRWATVSQAQRLGIEWNRGHYRLNEVVEILQVAETTVRRHRTKLRQRWRMLGKKEYSIVFGPSDKNIQALARSLLDNAGNVGASYKHLQQVAQGEWDIPERIRNATQRLGTI